MASITWLVFPSFFIGTILTLPSNSSELCRRFSRCFSIKWFHSFAHLRKMKCALIMSLPPGTSFCFIIQKIMLHAQLMHWSRVVLKISTVSIVETSNIFWHQSHILLNIYVFDVSIHISFQNLLKKVKSYLFLKKVITRTTIIFISETKIYSFIERNLLNPRPFEFIANHELMQFRLSYLT